MGQWAIEGFTAAGAADTAFNGGAGEEILGGIPWSPAAMAIQPDGKIVLAGESLAAGISSPEAVVARFTSGGLGAQGEPAFESIDDSQPGASNETTSFQTVGGAAWHSDPNGTTDGAFDGTQQYAPGNAGNQAAWTFAGLDPAEYYDVYVTWSPLAAPRRTPNTPSPAASRPSPAPCRLSTRPRPRWTPRATAVTGTPSGCIMQPAARSW